MKSWKWIFIILFLMMIGAIAMTVRYFLFTTQGSRVVTEFLLNRYLDAEKIDIHSVKGNLAETITFEGVVIKNPDVAPFPGTLRINRLSVSFRAYSVRALEVDIFNARLDMPGLEVLMLNGDYRAGILNMNAYARNIDVKTMLKMADPEKSLVNVSGYVKRIDIDIKGSLKSPELKGTFLIERLNHQRFSLVNSEGRLDLNFKNIKRNLSIQGYVALMNGMVSGPKTAQINLEESRIMFDGDPMRPTLNLRGVAVVEKVNIQVAVEGTVRQPRIYAMSNPSLPKERLLLMLATNQGWSGFDTILEQGQISPELAKDFVDYFFFSGSGNKLADYFGIEDFSVTIEDGRRGVGIKKAFTEQLRGTYQVEQTERDGQPPDVRQTIGGEYQITDRLSIEAEKELRQDETEEESPDAAPPDDRILFKFKKEF